MPLGLTCGHKFCTNCILHTVGALRAALLYADARCKACSHHHLMRQRLLCCCMPRPLGADDFRVG